MPLPSNRVPVRVLRGSKANLDAALADIAEGEIAWAIDEETVYVKAGGVLVRTTSDPSQLGIDELNDTDIGTIPLAAGNLLRYDGANWVNQSPLISDSGDVNTTLQIPQDGDILKWNIDAWITHTPESELYWTLGEDGSASWYTFTGPGFDGTEQIQALRCIADLLILSRIR